MSGNRMSQIARRMNALPGPLRTWGLTAMFNSQIKMAAWCGIRIRELSETNSVVTLKNRMPVQNHIKGVHAAAMALAAESATGIVFAMSVPDTHVPVIKSMHVDYVRRARGSLRAEASLPSEAVERIRGEEKGHVTVPVRVTDEAGEEPVKCEMVWAWVPKVRKTKEGQPTMEAATAVTPAAASAAASATPASATGKAQQ